MSWFSFKYLLLKLPCLTVVAFFLLLILQIRIGEENRVERAYEVMMSFTYVAHGTLIHKLIDLFTLRLSSSYEPLLQCGRTPLHYAAKRGGADVVSLLLEKGADMKAVDTVRASLINLLGFVA